MTSRRSLLLFTFALALAAGGCSKDPAVAKVEYLKSGDTYAAQDKLKEAIVQYRNAIQQDAQFGEAHFKLAEALTKSGDGPGAYQEYLRAADLMPANLDAQIKAGAMCLLAGQFEDARARADKALALNPASVDGHLLRGRALAGLKDLNAAVSQVEDAIKADPENSLPYSDLGVLHLAQGNPEKAEQAFKRAITLAPKSVEVRLALANYYWSSGNREVAEQTFKDAVALEPKNVAANRSLAYLFVLLNRGKEAEAPLKLVADETKDPNARLLLADYYRASGRLPLALQVLDELAGDPKAYAVARVRKSALLYTNGRKPEAHEAVEEVLKKDPQNSIALLGKATLLMADRDLDQALKLATTSAARDPQSVGALFLIGRIQIARGDLDDAMTALNDVLKLAPRFTPAQIELARASLLANRPKDALQFAGAALVNQPRNAEAILLKARALLAEGNVVGAEEPLKLLSASFPESPAVQAQLGTLYLQKRDLKSARAAYERALKGDSSNVEALGSLISLDFSDKHGENARARVEAALSSHKDMTPLLLLAARTYNTLGDRSKAESTARRVIELEPSNLAGYLFLGQLFATQNRLDEAIAEFEAVAKKKPTLVAPPTQIGIFLEMQGKRPDAVKWYKQALDIDKQAAIAANNLAMIYVDTGGNLDVALQLAQTAKSKLPDQHEINDTLGWIYVKKGLGAMAVAPLLMSVEKDPQNAIYHYHLGMAYVAAGNTAKARASLQKALALNANFDGAANARQTLAGLKG